MSAPDSLKMMSDLADAADKSRQKSCNACVRSKRRCDKQTPRCTRCAEKNFSCVYQNLPPAPAPAGAGGAVGAAVATSGSLGPDISSSSSSSACFTVHGQDDPLQAMDIEADGDDISSFDFNTLDNNHLLNHHHHHHHHNNQRQHQQGPQQQQQQPTPASSLFIDNELPTLAMKENINGSASGNRSTPVVPTSPLNLNIDAANVTFDFNTVMDFLTADPATGGEIKLWETPMTPVLQKSMTPELHQMNDTMWETDMKDMCQEGGFQPWQIHEPSSRVGHLLGVIKNMHITFAQTMQTPFLHRHLYLGTREIPRSLMAAYTAISAYVGRTEANKDWAIRALCEGTAEVLKGSKDAKSLSSSNLTGHEKLARAQALWLLQTIRCYDGDVALRAQAERDMDVLKRWLEELESMRDNFDDMHILEDTALRARPPRSWEVWVFNECVRRTVLLGYVFIGLYDMLKSAGEFEPDPKNWLVPHRWTFSKHLWEAQSSPAFYSAWHEKPMFLANAFFVQRIARMARPADVDDFAKIFLTMNVGVEEMKHFMLEG
ncbi:Putative zn(2)Cys(6) fungal-type DNA-binding domain-containing protein [Colletotrichum destructivum]|uniref:Zn(2)Cys(6) fungal-type DNA-binding domain-containing protein n=1 Tax=Colletotrichum destructivum TaxID=34406 RepID=A0AAX4INA9_9PEZI|nr:Putative zn(2)Cys(6) fungal-type DNA-binding domain-containing protein [Colletotrichum destructivum]